MVCCDLTHQSETCYHSTMATCSVVVVYETVMCCVQAQSLLQEFISYIEVLITFLKVFFVTAFSAITVAVWLNWMMLMLIV